MDDLYCKFPRSTGPGCYFIRLNVPSSSPPTAGALSPILDAGRGGLAPSLAGLLRDGGPPPLERESSWALSKAGLGGGTKSVRCSLSGFANLSAGPLPPGSPPPKSVFECEGI